MILRSLELKSFGQFLDKSYEFRRGMNLVIGPNEAGKSTMMESIPAILFGYKDKKRFQTWGRNSHCLASLMLQNQHKNISIQRDIDTDHVELKQFDDMYQEQCHFAATVGVGEHSPPCLEYSHHLQNFFGINDEVLFRASLFVAQGDFPSNANEIEQQLRTLLSGFNRVDIEFVRKSFQDDYSAITNDNPWNEIKTSPRELEVVQDALADVDARRLNMQQLMRQLQQLRDQIGDLERTLDHDRDEYQQGIEYLIWIQKQWQSGSQLPVDDDSIEVESDSALMCECRQLEKTLLEAGLPTEIPQYLPRLLADADDIRCDLVALQQEMVPLRRTLKAILVPSWKKGMLASFLLAVLCGVGCYFYPEWLNELSAVSAACLLGFWGRFWVCYRQKILARQQVEKQLAEVELRRGEDRSRLDQLDDEFERHGLSSSAIELVKMKKILEAHEHILHRLSEVRQAIQSGSETAVDTARSEPLSDNGEGGESGAEEHHHLRPEELADAQQKLNELNDNIKKRETELLLFLRQQAVFQGRLVDSENLDVTEDQLRQRVAELEERKKVLGCAYHVLVEAIAEFRRTNLHTIEEEIGIYLSKATIGKYRAVAIGDDFSVTVKGSGRDEWIALEHLSRGTIDVAFLAIRLALTRFLTHNEYLPFFLDDALVNLDSDRLLNAVDALERLSSDHQIVMFTHDERLYKLAARRRWHVVSLGGQRSRRSTRTKEGKYNVGEHSGQLSLL